MQPFGMDKKVELDNAAFSALNALLDEALELPPQQLPAFLQGVDESLRPQLEALLQAADCSLVDQWVSDSVADAFASKASAEAPISDQQVGPWQLTRQLGTGGMAQVYHGVRNHEGYQQSAAIKILLPFREGEGYVERFVRESRILAALEHPNIARFVDGGVLADGRPWLAMEYVEGVGIVEYCAANALTISARLKLFLQVCAAVEYAHARMIVHRDIKPENILVDESGRVRLLDFGIAKMVDEIDLADRTRTGNSLMTLRYASPEQVTNAYVNAASDVYQLGLLLFELLTDEQFIQHNEKSLDEVVAAICDSPARRPSSVRSNISRDLDEMVLQCLRKEPEARYGSVAALAEDVRRYQKGRPVSARAPSRWYYLQRFVQRNRFASIAGAVAAATLLVASIVSVRWATRAAEETARSEAAQAILGDIFVQANPFGAGGADVKIAEALAARMPDIEERVSRDPRLALTIYSQLGPIYRSLGMHDEALRVWRAAFDRAGGLDQADKMTAVAGLCRALLDVGNFDDVVQFASTNLPAHPPSATSASDWVSAQIVLAIAHRRLDDPAEVERLVVSAKAVVAEFGVDDPGVLINFGSLESYLAEEQGDEEAAIAAKRRSVEYARQTGKPDDIAVTLHNLGLQLGKARRFAEAEPYFREAIDVVKGIAPDHPLRAYHTLNYAGLLFRMGRREDAVAMGEIARDLLRDSENRNWRYVADRDMAQYAFAVGDIPVAASAVLSSLQSTREVYGDESPQFAISLLRLARFAQFAGQPAWALAVLERIESRFPVLAGVSVAVERAKILVDTGDLADAEMLVKGEGFPVAQAPSIEVELRLACALGGVDTARTLRGEASALLHGDNVASKRLSGWFAFLSEQRNVEDRATSLGGTYFDTARSVDVLDRWRMVNAVLSVLPSAPGESGAALRQARAEVGRLRITASDLMLGEYWEDFQPYLQPLTAPLSPAVGLYDPPAFCAQSS